MSHSKRKRMVNLVSESYTKVFGDIKRRFYKDIDTSIHSTSYSIAKKNLTQRQKFLRMLKKMTAELCTVI